MRVCLRKSDGAFIEAQSHATAGTLIANAVAAGYSASDIEEREVTAAECLALMPSPTKDERAVMAIDSADRLQFEIMFEHENRVRTLEGLAAVTRAQFRTALINRWKALN